MRNDEKKTIAEDGIEPTKKKIEKKKSCKLSVLSGPPIQLKFYVK